MKWPRTGFELFCGLSIYYVMYVPIITISIPTIGGVFHEERFVVTWYDFAAVGVCFL
jgi:hypothetical protein